MRKKNIIIISGTFLLLTLLIVISILFANLLGVSDGGGGGLWSEQEDYVLSDYLSDSGVLMVSDEDRVCEKDKDCRAINLGCCVTMGNVNKANLNKYQDLHNQYKEENCDDTYCAPRSCSDEVAGCLDENVYCIKGYCENGGY